MLTKTERKQLDTIRANLQRAVNYLNRPDIVGIATRTTSPLGNDYTIRNAACLESCAGQTEHIRPVNHHIGSDIAGLYTALSQISEFLDPPTPTLFDET